MTDEIRRTTLKGITAFLGALAAAQNASAQPNGSQSQPASSDGAASPANANPPDSANQPQPRAPTPHQPMRMERSSVTPAPSPTVTELTKAPIVSDPSLRERLRVSSNTLADLENRQFLHGFSYASSPIDGTFREMHADILIAHAEQFLDRCLTARAEWDDLYLRAYNFSFELECPNLNRIGCIMSNLIS